MTVFDRSTINLKALNSLTKYPSIPTYHELDPRNGGLLDNPVRFDGEVILTEKLDGCNARITLLPDGTYLLGSRENLLYASGDLIGDPALGIVDNLRDVANDLPPIGSSFDGDTAMVFYLELYGGKIGSQAKQYSARGTVGWRLFDIATVAGLAERLEWPAERISGWRDSGGQDFANEATLQADAEMAGLELAPRLTTTYGDVLPRTVDGMYELLKAQLPGTLVALDDSGKGAAEGIVLRSPDRRVIAKARFQDYERALKRRARGAA